MVLAVYMPPHEPGPGHDSHSTSCNGLEDGDDVERFALAADAGHDAAAVDEHARDVEAGEGHDAAGHVLVATAEGENAVVIHAAGDDLDAIGNDLARDEAVAHALVAHHDAVGGGGRAEDLRHAAGAADALDALARQAVEVGVARRDVGVQVGDADDRPVEVVVVEADGPKHGAVGGAARSVGGGQAGAVRPIGHARGLRESAGRKGSV
jgi:hypothetical protein